MKTMSIAMLGLLWSLQVMAGTNPPTHAQIEMQAGTHKVARHVHDKTVKPTENVSTIRPAKAALSGK